MSDQLDPRETDRLAVQAEFFRNVKQYAREDVLGQAPRNVQVKLRDKLNLKAWMVALDQLLAESTSPDFKRMVHLKKLECSDLRMAEARIERMQKQRAAQDRGTEAADYFKDTLATYGWDFPAGMGTKEITCILLASIEKNTRGSA